MWSQFLAPLHVDENDFCLLAAAGAILGAVFGAPFALIFSVPEPGAWFRQRYCITQPCYDALGLQNEAVWLTQLRLSRNMNIEKMNARTPLRPQGNVEGASTLTDATLLMEHGAFTSIKARCSPSLA